MSLPLATEHRARGEELQRRHRVGLVTLVFTDMVGFTQMKKVRGTEWTLVEKLGEGGFGEVWLGRHDTLQQRRVFKFCFRANRVRALKREVAFFRLLQERVGEQPSIVRLLEVFFDEPPFYPEMEYVAGKALKSWGEAQRGLDKTPLATRLEIVAQAADALQAAHDAGVIHRDVKPGN